MKVAISEKRSFQIVKCRWMGQLMSVTYPDQQEEEEAGPIKTWRVFGAYHLNQKDLSIDALPKCLIYRKSICTPISSALKKTHYFLAASSATAAIVAAPLLWGTWCLGAWMVHLSGGHKADFSFSKFLPG
jgi:hypothetical protein